VVCITEASGDRHVRVKRPYRFEVAPIANCPGVITPTMQDPSCRAISTSAQDGIVSRSGTLTYEPSRRPRVALPDDLHRVGAIR